MRAQGKELAGDIGDRCAGEEEGERGRRALTRGDR
jgi:hypothetical protein